MFSSDDYYNDGLTFVEFFNTKCGHCQDQEPILNDIYAKYMNEESPDYTSSFNMFAIGGYKLGNGQDSVQILLILKQNMVLNGLTYL